MPENKDDEDYDSEEEEKRRLNAKVFTKEDEWNPIEKYE